MRRGPLLPIAVLLASGAGYVYLSSLGEKASRGQPELRPQAVEVQLAKPESLRPVLELPCEVIPARELQLTAEVSGAILYTAPQLRPGGRFAQGELLAQIQPRDFSLRLEQQRALLQDAELSLALEQARQSSAQREQELLGQEGSALARREPQLAAALAARDAAEASVELAELALARTRLVAPFPSILVEEQLEKGQVVTPGQALATLVDSQAVHARCSLSVSALPMLGLNDDSSSRSPGSLLLSTGKSQPWEAEMLGLAGALNPETRTAEVLLAVRNPRSPAEGQLPLLPGGFAEAILEGEERAGLIQLPEEALVEGRRVWTVTEEDRLRLVEVSVLGRRGSQVLIQSGLEPEQRVVVSPLAQPVDGLTVDVRQSSEDAP